MLCICPLIKKTSLRWRAFNLRKLYKRYWKYIGVFFLGEVALVQSGPGKTPLCTRF